MIKISRAAQEEELGVSIPVESIGILILNFASLRLGEEQKRLIHA
jgi:hypothetical protein